jgi:hypothetical protein
MIFGKDSGTLSIRGAICAIFMFFPQESRPNRSRYLAACREIPGGLLIWVTLLWVNVALEPRLGNRVVSNNDQDDSANESDRSSRHVWHGVPQHTRTIKGSRRMVCVFNVSELCATSRSPLWPARDGELLRDGTRRLG